MKMRLNGKPFKLYVIDSAESVEERIAAVLLTLPKWLVYAKPVSVKAYEASDLTVFDYLRQRVLNQHTLTVPAPPYPADVTVAQVEDLFIGTNATLAASDDRSRDILLRSIKNLHRDVDAIWRDRTRVLGLLNKAIEANRTKTQRLERVAADFEAISPVPFTPYEIDHVQFTLNLGKFESNLSTLFDALVTCRFVPYAALAEDGKLLFKLHSGFKFNPEWLSIQLTDVLLLKVNSDVDGVKPLQLVYKSYTNAAFAIQDGTLLVTMDLNVGPRFVDREKFVRRVLDSFRSLNLVKQSERDNQVVVYYSIPTQCIDTFVFGELAMNNPLFNSLIAIDEFLRPSKLSSSVYIHRLGGIGTLNMALKQTRKANEYGMANIGEWYIRCRVRTETTDDIVPLQTVMGKLMSLYNSEYDNVTAEYKRYIPPFAPEDCSSTVAPKRSFVAKGLRAVAPEIFYPTYSRKCANPPIVVAQDDRRGDSLVFPIKGETVDGKRIEPRTYACVEASHPFIGLRKNDLANRDVFPAVPCCFKRDQKDKRGSLYRSYYFEDGEPAVERQIQQTEAFRKRALNPGETEILPENIVRLFSALESNPNISYVRNGVTKSRLASVEAILLGKGQIAYKRMRKSTVINRVIRDAIKLDSEAYAMAAKQELYDMDLDEIRDMIRTADLRPSKFVHALETSMDCNIFVFASSNDEPKGKLVVPSHSAFYSRFKPNRETFFLYELYEQEEPYPSVELITRTDGRSFLPGDVIVKKLFDFFTKMTRAHLLNDFTDIVVPKFPRLPVTGQLVDANGKCRLINVRASDGTDCSLVTNPLPPFAAPLARQIRRVDREGAKRFLDEWRLTATWQRLGEVGLRVGNVDCVLLTRKSVRLADVKVDISNTEFDDLDVPNSINVFGLSKRHASILLEYALKAASNLLPMDKMNVDAKLAMIAIRVDPGVKYEIKSDRFDSNPSFASSGVIVVPCHSLLKRLLFIVRMYVLYTPGKVALYRTRDKLSSFYSNVRDFIDTPTTIILAGPESIENVLRTFESAEKRVFSSVIPDSTKPYFFRNTLLSDGPFLAIPVGSLDEANDSVVAWTTRGYYDKSEIVSTAFRPPVYAIVNEYDIEEISGGDGLVKYNGTVLAYKSVDKNQVEFHYIALLTI